MDVVDVAPFPVLKLEVVILLQIKVFYSVIYISNQRINKLCLLISSTCNS